MLLKRRLAGKRLADLCHRLAISTESGIDIRRTWQREADNASGSLSRVYGSVRDGVSRGEALAASLAAAGVFPPLFLEMVDVGEKTGSLAEVLRRLSDHYQQRAEMNRNLRAGLTWPLIQLGLAVMVVGLLLAVFATLDVKRLNGEPVDLFGVGVTGWGAVTLYVQMLIGVSLLVLGLVVAVQRGVLNIKPLQRLVMAVPMIGSCVEKICLARLAWVLHLTLNVEMDLRRIVPLALRATGSDYYARWSNEITGLVAAGNPLYLSFGAGGFFPTHFLDALQVAEESGQIVESMSRLSKQYEEEARSAMRMLTVLTGVAIGLGILALIGLFVIRFFLILYVGTLNDALNL